ncbi:reverse transcriptase family protein [Microbacterium sp. 22296]|uniref:reverse transcriptase family protein n=1 Tax=Microbacterium sp. 22296 TaxID=3453903 RepID=UPI003F83E2E0
MTQWQDWARPYHSDVSFRSGRRWRTTKRAIGRLDIALKLAKGILAAGWVPQDCVHGFVRGRSTVSGAAPHVGAKVVLAVDLKDFYGQISFDRVAPALAEQFDTEVLAWIEGVCFIDGTLPLGFRTSPYLSNLAFQETDRSIEMIASARGISYTRWVDDLSFSHGELDDAFLRAVREVVGAAGWALNDRKTRFMRRSPYVLGLYVGHDVDEPRLPRWVKRKILLESYYFAKHGDSHFESPGVYPRLTLLGLCAYAFSVEPELADKIYPRLAAGIRQSGRRARQAGDAVDSSYLNEAEFDRLIAALPDE